MMLHGLPPAAKAGAWRHIALLAACIALAASLLACAGGGQDSTIDERMLELEAKAHSQEEALERLTGENARLREELATVKQEQADFVEAQEAADAAREHEEEVADFEEVQEQQLAALEEGQANAEQRLDALEESQADSGKRLDNLDGQVRGLETVASQVERVLPLVEKVFTDKEDSGKLQPQEGSPLERTAMLAEAAGGEVYNIDSGEPEERAILVMPPGPIDGNPLIVSLHGFDGNSLLQSVYVPLHEEVVSRGFGLLLPNGTTDSEGRRFWNPTDLGSDTSKANTDDVGYLTGLVARAKELKDFGPVYFFGYSNGGFMAYHMACKGVPGLRAVASLAGTSYVEDSSCEGAAPVSVLHVHGDADTVIRFEGDVAKSVPKGDGEPAFYASAEEMVTRWAARAGCQWPADPQPYATLDLDGYVPGAETQAFRLEAGCAEGISIELWRGEGSSHSPGYGGAFVEALLDWLLSQR